jgi:hypothetical protein
MAEIYNSIVPNKIKIDYTSNGNKNNLNYDSNYLNINTWYFGIDVNRPYYPSSGTGWYQGIDNRSIDDLVYTIYYTGSTIGNTGNANDKYRCVQFDDQQGVIDFVNKFTATTTIEAAFNWFKEDGSGNSGGEKGKNVCVNMNYPNIPTSGLTFALDAGHVASYPWIGSTWYDFRRSAMSGFSGTSSVIARFDNGSLLYDFNSTGQYFIDPNTPRRQLGNTFTLMFWAFPSYVNEGDTPTLFSCTPTFSQRVGFYNTGGFIYFYYNITDTTNSTQSRIGVNALDDRSWHLYTYVFAPDDSAGKSNISFYVDGVLNETNQEDFEPSNWNPNIEPFTLGNLVIPSNRQQYRGGLQVFLAYNRVLSNKEIADIYQNYYDTRSLFA